MTKLVFPVYALPLRIALKGCDYERNRSSPLTNTRS